MYLLVALKWLPTILLAILAITRLLCLTAIITVQLGNNFIPINGTKYNYIVSGIYELTDTNAMLPK